MSALKLILFVASLMAISTPSIDAQYQVPYARVESLYPSGFRVSIPDSPGIQLFAFHGSINRPLNGLEAGDFSRDITRSTGGRWVFEDRRTNLRSGDVLYYWTYVQLDGLGYRRDNQVYRKN